MRRFAIQITQLMLLCTVMPLLLAGCDGRFSVGSKRMIQMEVIEDEGSRQLEEVIGAEGGRAKLNCPGKEIEAQRGNTIKCTLVDSTTREVYDAVVELTDDTGKFDVQVARNPREMQPTNNSDDDS